MIEQSTKPRAPRLRRPPFPFAILVWDDAFVANGEVTAEEISHHPVRFYSAGWVLREDEHGVSIAAEWSPDQSNFRGVTFVPRGMIREVRRV